MSLYRVKQFYWSMTSKLDLMDIELINKFLNTEEKELFNSISTYEQKHSVKVAMDVIKLCEANNIKNDNLIKVALLHDIGKSYKKLNPVEKSLVVMLDNISKGKLKKFKNLKQVDVYYNHADKGYNILKNKGKYDERFLYLIKNHHNTYVIGDKELDMLKICDSKN
jgi:putative nucleotidyltransferase with HDIG domain